jgi:hypothetical protein
MLKECPIQNRFVDEMDRQRLYKQHLKALACAKPSVETHQTPTKKFQRSKRRKKIHRIFDGSKLQEEFCTQKQTPDFDIFSTKSEPPSFRLRLPVTEAVKMEGRAARGAESARVVHRQKERPKAAKRNKPLNDVIRPRREELEKKLTVPVVEVTREPTVSFGADMWDTSDESDDEPCDLKCFALPDDDENDF